MTIKKIYLNKKKYFINFVVLLISLIFISKSLINCIKYDADFAPIFTLLDLFWKKNNVIYNVDLNPDLNPFYPHSFYILFYFFTLFKFEVAKIFFFFLIFFC